MADPRSRDFVALRRFFFLLYPLSKGEIQETREEAGTGD